ncbi:transposable element Tcb2 transposase [Trichonephila clavipes]|uniref:Transposable element Tcb2 transposase n=1 Tax=Trichonephila clavipes TaxID=2585209 RepID=A0A8X7BBL3_TRICX|nr:transposable element Tcb2 transposase [Trichonephila clavipes]
MNPDFICEEIMFGDMYGGFPGNVACLLSIVECHSSPIPGFMVRNGIMFEYPLFTDWNIVLDCSSSCASASSSNARELDEQILEVKINPQEKTVSNTSTNKDTLSKENVSENKNEETKLIRNDFVHYVAGEIARHTTQATGRPISRFTVARRLHGGGLFARRPVRCVPLTPAHRRRRSLWCREHRNWRDNEWGGVLFTDESRFSLSSDSHRILIWRERGSRNHPSNIIERNRGAMGLQFLFMDDNAPCHRTVAAEQLLESEDIERMDWPARSPDLNTIEHVWDLLGRRLAARTLPPVTIRELRLALQDEWAAMPQQLIDTLILSMGR